MPEPRTIRKALIANRAEIALRVIRACREAGIGTSRRLHDCLRLVQPTEPGIREDAAIYEGYEVPLDRDPLLSKLIAYGHSREAAIERLLAAPDVYVIGEILTNLALFRRILLDPEFRAARIDTGYLERLLADRPVPAERDVPEEMACIAAALFSASTRAPQAAERVVPAATSPWALAGRREALGL